MNSEYDTTLIRPTQTSGDGGDGGDGSITLDLERYWLEARVLKFWIGGIIAGCLLLSLIVTLLLRPVYEAQARIEVSQITANVTDIDPLDGGASVSENQYLNTQ
ncbi:MAG: Wzz/FepE/Etk N-terminal domain-containing protein, partial [Pseudomonadota bacterium]